MPHQRVRPFLAGHKKIGALQSAPNTISGNLRQAAQAVNSTSLISRRDSFGNGRPSSLRLSA